MITSDQDEHPGYRRAVSAFGSASRLALALGITRQAVSKWRQNGVPADAAVRLERMRPGELRAVELVDTEQTA